ncbi:hypothetical protein MMC29_007571 [Sticta canariensis]|nr:hypothetical protein [Sticta canariensis]
MAVGRDQAHSTLEAASQQRLPFDQERQLAVDGGAQLAVDEGKQLALDGGKQWIGNEVNGELEVASQENIDRQNTQVHHVLAQRPSARRWIVLGGITGLIVILGAVLGGVLGSRHKSSVTASSTSPSNSSTSPSNSSTSPSNPSAPSPSVTPTQRNIAAVSFTSNSANTSRVYFQDKEGQIIEASSFEPNMTWNISKIGIGGKNGSAIAAAVSRPTLPLEISLFYLDVNNLVHDIIYTGSTGDWTSGTLSAQNYTTVPNSSLSAVYHWCRFCANTTLIAFQDENGFVQIGNLTSRGWTFNQLGQALEPVIGTGLALQSFRGGEHSIDLYYQKSVLNMSLASWAEGNQEVNGWRLNDNVYNLIPSGSPIAAASSYSKVSTGWETWIEILSLSTTGIEVNTWSGAKYAWLTHDGHPSAMANSTKNMKSYESVAVTSTGNAFAVVKQDGQADSIESWRVEDDLVDWRPTGDVDLHGTWG